MKLSTPLFFLVIGLIVLSFLPLLPDPYLHRENITFWDWASREIDELINGEM